MAQQRSILIFAGIIAFAVTLALFFALAQARLSPSPKELLAPCNVLQYNGQDKINLLLIGEEETANFYNDYLFSKEPFLRNQQEFNVYSINKDLSKECSIYKGIAVLCYSKELLNLASSCPHDIVAVFAERSPEIRSSSYRGVISINTRHLPTVFLHEIGHALANLAEEYVIPAPPQFDSKNCETQCKSFSIQEGCSDGCSDEKHVRASETSVMRSLKGENYGLNNELIIEEKISSITSKKSSITGRVADSSIDCEEQTHYRLVLQETEDSIEVLDKIKVQGCPEGNLLGTKTYKLINQDGEIASGLFSDGTIFTDAESSLGLEGEMFASKEPFYLALAIQSGAEAISFFDSENNPLGENSLGDTGARLCKI